MNARVDRVDRLLQSNIERIDNNAKSVREMEGKLERIEKNVVSRLESNEKEIRQRDRELEQKVEDMFKKKEAETLEQIKMTVADAMKKSPPPQRQPESVVIQERNRDTYDIHRRSLRFWPVRGDDLQKALMTFLREKMKLGDLAIHEIGPVSVQKLAGAAERKRGKILATFQDKETRDMVKASAVNLAGSSDAGTRLQVPGYLMDNFRALEAVGYSMKKIDKNTKRSIKFDDCNLDLVMDVKVGDDWMRINATEARAVCRENPDLRAGPKKMDRKRISKFLSSTAGNDDAGEGTVGEEDVVEVPMDD